MHVVAVALFVALCATPRSQDATSYDDVWAEARSAAERGRFIRAARTIEAARSKWPQDYWLALEAGWLRFQAGHYRRAAASYREAITLSGGALDARLGLAWSLLNDGRRREALAQFERIATDTSHSRAQEAWQQARARHPVEVRPWGSFTLQAYADHPVLERGIGGQGGLSVLAAEHLLLSASYGYARLAWAVEGEEDVGGARGMGMGPGRTRTERGGFDQHQVHASLGPVWTIAGVALQYGHLRGGDTDDIHAIGTSIRYSPLGDIVLDASVSLSSDAPLVRLVPSWRIPVARHFWLRPAASVQSQGRSAPVAGLLTATVHGRPGAMWLGAKGGRERRPVDLSTPVIFNLAGDIRWGVWAGGLVHLPKRTNVSLSYELHGLEVDDAVEDRTVWARAHYLTLGVGWRSR